MRRPGTGGDRAWWRGIVLAVSACTATAKDEPVDSGEDSDTASPTDSDTDVVPAHVELGTGTFGGVASCDGFEAVVDDQPLALVHGVQGGWHLDVSLRGTGLPELAVITYRVVDVALDTVVSQGDPIVTNKRLLGADPDGPWTGEGCYLGLEARIDFTALGEDASDPDRYQALVGRTVRLELAVSDGDTPVAEDTRQVEVAPDPCDADPTAPGCLCDPDAGFRPDFCDPDTDGA